MVVFFSFASALLVGLVFASCEQSHNYDSSVSRPPAGSLTVRGHYLFYREKPIAVIGNSATQSVMQNLNHDYQAWLDDLAANKIRFAMIWSWSPVRQHADGSLVEERWGYIVPDLTPWKRSTKGTARDGLSHWDLGQFDPRYWQRLENVCQAALQRDILLLIVIFDGWAKDFRYHPFNRVNGGPLTDVRDGREEFATLFEYGREVLAETFDPSWPAAKQNQYYQERFVDRLLQVTGRYDNVFYEIYNEGSVKEEYDQHFVEFVGKRTNKLIVVNDDYTPFSGFHHPVVDIISWHTLTFDPTDIYTRWKKGFFTTSVKPIVNTETVPSYYAGKRALSDDEMIVSVRNVVDILWGTLVAGGGIFLQDDTVFAFDPSAPAMGDGEGRRYFGYASQFFEEHKVAFWQMAPGASIINGGLALSAPGEEYLIYIPDGGGVHLDLSSVSGRPYAVHWYDPMQGKTLGRAEAEGGKIHQFTLPAAPLVAHIRKM